MIRLAIRMFVTGAALYSLFLCTAMAQDPWPRPAISIIIDDIGYRHGDDQRALDLPGPVAYAIMPHAPFAALMSDLAAKNGKEIPWVLLPRLTTDIFFSHRRHVAVSKIKCASCHGPIERADSAPTERVTEFSMKWCMHCHQVKEASLDCLACHR